MSLETEIIEARKTIFTDGYDMSFGEVMNLYKDKELIINPDFQRLFRWDISRKTRFVESLLLGIPIPPIFVFQNEDGVWELIDGLQRLSTVFEFAGVLWDADGNLKAPSVLEGTKYLPDLSNRRWEQSTQEKDDSIGKNQQLQIKRARIRVEILKQGSDPKAKYELFQRLNTGGAELSEQEVRNCIAVMLNKTFYSWLLNCAANENFLKTIDQTETAKNKQAAVELALRFFAFRNVPYQPGLDVHEYLDDAMIKMATNEAFPADAEKNVFERTFKNLRRAMGNKAFKKWDRDDFRGMFLMSVFEVIATGVSKNLDDLEQLEVEEQKALILTKAKDLWNNPIFKENSGAGIRGTTRLTRLLPMAEEFFQQ
ncbi:MAG: DUF262 domain-containing protein [Syntrophorhabdaceae bacterium]|nr:DUF262 domain-containing protein [Syntrophorhabdaceae bacterium]